MARLPRLYAPGLPQLVRASFAAPLVTASQPVPTELLNQLALWLSDAALHNKVAVHGWLVAIDCVLLLATPSDGEGLPRLMQTLGRNLAARLRSGRVFAGRYRSALVEPGHWVLPALIWLESAPLQGLQPRDAERWPWSSVAGHIGATSATPSWTHDHPDFLACGNTPSDRQANYHRLLTEGLSSNHAVRIQQAIMGQWALGSPAFLAKLTTTASRRAAPGKRGRPRKTPPGAPKASIDHASTLKS
jgi:putative transposase